MRIGVRDILGKDTTTQTVTALSDLAETILVQIATLQYPPLVKRLGLPSLGSGIASRYVLLGLGKLGGQEMSYHSDLDLILVYEGDGRTVPPPGSSRFDTFELTDNFHFFTDLARQIIKVASYLRDDGPPLPRRHAPSGPHVQIGQPGDSAPRVPKVLRPRRRFGSGNARP